MINVYLALSLIVLGAALAAYVTWRIAIAPLPLPAGSPAASAGPYVVLTVPRDALFVAAQQWTARFARMDGSGEAKRHQVLARLKKEFPQATEREIAHAIEAALEA